MTLRLTAGRLWWIRSIVWLALLLPAISPVRAAVHNPDTDWFRDAGWGVFVHYLWDVQDVGHRANTMGQANLRHEGRSIGLKQG